MSTESAGRLELQKLISTASESIEKIFRKQGGLAPMYHAVKRNGTALIVPAMSDDKDEGVAMIKALFVIEDVVRYVFIDEAWILGFDESGSNPKPDMARIRREGLRDHPDRREVVMFAAENLDGDFVAARRFILRPEHGKPSLSPLKPFSGASDGFSGRMVGLLR